MIPNNDASQLTLTCTDICSDSNPTIAYDFTFRKLTLKNIFSSYVPASSSIKFTLKGWTNPATTTAQTFTLNSYWDDSGTPYLIDTNTGASIAAKEGLCEINDMYPTDGNTMFRDTPSNYTVVMKCLHSIETTHGIQLAFPTGATDWIIKDTSRCEVAGDLFSTRYSCNGYNNTVVNGVTKQNTVEFYSFLDTEIGANTEFTFTIGDVLINPGTLEETGTIYISTVSNDGSRLDVGNYTFEDGYFNTSIIETFEVTPLDTGVGMFPVTYRFRVIPTGDVPAGAYMELELPDEVKILSESALEKQCGGDYRDTLLGFSYWKLNCQVRGNDNELIRINDGFKYLPTTNFSDPDIDNRYDPPEFYFELPQFVNPRETVNTGTFNITIYNADRDKIYVWNTTDKPVVRMSGAAKPGLF